MLEFLFLVSLLITLWLEAYFRIIRKCAETIRPVVHKVARRTLQVCVGQAIQY